MTGLAAGDEQVLIGFRVETCIGGATGVCVWELRPVVAGGPAHRIGDTVPSADQILKSLDARIGHLESELRDLRAARAALTGGAGEVTTAHQQTPSGRRAVSAEREPVPQAVLQAVERWDVGGRRAQAPIAWQRDRWLAAMPGEAQLLLALPDMLDRSIVRQLVWEKPATARGMFEAMAIVYAWGWSTRAVGVPRAQKALALGPERLGPALLAAREAIGRGGPADGYIALAGPHRVGGLGPSFGTKFLYFVSPEGRRALILDELVSTWLDREAAVTLNWNRWSVRTYERYLTIMRVWSSQLGIADDQLEEVLFTAEATRRGLAGWAAPNGEG